MNIIYTDVIFASDIIEYKEVVGDFGYYRYKANFIVELREEPKLGSEFKILLDNIPLDMVVSKPLNYCFIRNVPNSKSTISFFNLPLDVFSGRVPEVTIRG